MPAIQVEFGRTFRSQHSDGRQCPCRFFNLLAQQEFDPQRHVEKILGTVGEGDVSVAWLGAGSNQPYHCHPSATEIYFCFQAGGTMKHPMRQCGGHARSFVVHPAGELHEYANGPERTLLFRVRYGTVWPPDTSNGVAGRIGRNALRTASISGATRRVVSSRRFLSNEA